MNCGPHPKGVASRICCAVHACVGARVTDTCTTRAFRADPTPIIKACFDENPERSCGGGGK